MTTDLFSLAGRSALIDQHRVDPWRLGQLAETYSYAASKAGLIPLARRMALRLAKDGIVVSAIAPGAFASDMNRLARDHGDELAKAIPAGRIGTDEDVAGAAIYLVSRAGDHVVGSTLVADGGVTLARG